MKLPRGYKLGRTRFGLSFITNTHGKVLVYGLTDEAALRGLQDARGGPLQALLGGLAPFSPGIPPNRAADSA